MAIKIENPETLIQGINLTLDNANRLFSCACQIKNLENYGLANSLYILCCEEAIKAFALYNNFVIDDNRDITGIFKFHKEKLDILKSGYHIISSETLAMQKSFKQAINELQGQDDEQIEKRASELNDANFDFFYSNYKNKLKDDKWWDSANINKQNGFYVGLENLHWLTPADISLSQVEEAAEKAKLVLGHVIQYRNPDRGKFKSRKT